MTTSIVRRSSPAAVLVCLCLLLGVGGLTGCGALDVADPTAIQDSELEDAAGAELLRGAALHRFYRAVGQGAFVSGLLSDELFSDPPAIYQQQGIVAPEEVLDRRESERSEQLNYVLGPYSMWQESRRAATIAIPRVLRHAPAGAAEAEAGELLAVRAYAALRLAEDFCPGFPLHDIVDRTPVYGPPLTTAQAFERALADLDSALVYAADSARVLDLVRVGRGRALLGLGRFSEAGAVVQGVSVDFLRQAEFSTGDFTLQNPFSPYDITALVRGVGNQEGGTGLDFVTAGDPRLETDSVGVANDGVTTMYAAAKYPDTDAPIIVASGVEARLIAAEAALHDGGDWLGILNALRAATPGLAPLADPGTPEARVDLLFRERAFWLFGTGHRLGDLRRLIAHYGRSSETVFPTGSYRLGGVYETATSIPFPAAAETPFNPAVTGCTSR